MNQSDKKPRPLARTEGLVVRELREEVLVYDLERHRAVCLNRTAAAVWRLCDGRRDADSLARRLGEELKTEAPREVVLFALEQLERERLLAGTARRARRGGTKAGAGVSRRELLKRAGVGAALALPLVTSILAPTPAKAASCLPTGSGCGTSAQCCSGLCSNGACT